MLQTHHSCFLKESPSSDLPPISVILRGVNLSSSSKVPSFPCAQPGPSTRRDRDNERLHEAGHQSHLPDPWTCAEQGGRDGWFVGHPLNEDDVDVHLSRLIAWGFRAVRLVVTWESLEHAGPGQYDDTYIDYLIRILHRCKVHGLSVFISAHQDVFSRFVGGCGAPYWVLLALGLAPRRLHQTGAAIIHAQWATDGYGGEGVEAGDFPTLIWNTNLNRLASRHCFTMFWASHIFAPKCTLDGIPVGQWLQKRHVEAYGHLASRLAETDLLDTCVIGWDSMNEPHEGFIGIPDLSTIPACQQFRKGPSPTPLQGFQLASGQSVSDILYDDFGSLGLKTLGKVTIAPPDGSGAWLTRDEAEAAAEKYGWDRGDSPVDCPWAAHGVWDDSGILKKDYFHTDDSGKAYDFMPDFWLPHYTQYINTLRKHHPEAISFVNPPVFDSPPDLNEDVKHGRMALTPHFYDGLTMLAKRRHVFNVDTVALQRGTMSMFRALKLGSHHVKKGIRHEFAELKGDASDCNGIASDLSGRKEYPTLVGELGVPFDMKKTSLLGLAQGKREPGDYERPAKAMDELLNGCEGSNCLSYTLWTYEPTNTHLGGDGWNGEDLSIFTYDDLEGDDDIVAERPADLSSLICLGSRAIKSWCRPYPAEVMGRTQHYSFDWKTSVFDLRIRIITLSVSRLWQDDQNQRGVMEAAEEGWTLIYLPFVHYLRTDPSEEGEKRVIGGPASIEWRKGQPASVDLEVMEMTEGRLVIEGQWAKWYYPLRSEKDRDVRLKIKKWKS